MGAPHISNVGSYVKNVACGATRATAAGAGDNTAVTGAGIDRLGYNSAKFTVAYKTSLTAAATLSLQCEYQTSADNSSWDTAVVLQALTVVKTGAVSAFVGDLSFNLDLESLKRYVRFNFTPDLSAGATDTVDAAAVATLGGPNALPAA
jgi:hypothetical protein